MNVIRLPILKHGLMTWDKTLLPNSEVDARLARVRQAMAAQGLDALVTYSDLRHAGHAAYLSNFQVFDPRMPAIILVTQDLLEAVLKVTSRNLFFIAPRMWANAESVDFLSGDMGSKFAGLAEKHNLLGRRIGVAGAESMPAAVHNALYQVFSSERIVDADDLLLAMERDKSPVECDIMRLAAGKAETVLREVLERAAKGSGELELAALADFVARREGCQDVDFLVHSDELGPDEWPLGEFPFRPAGAYPRAADRPLGVYLAVQCHNYWVELTQSLPSLNASAEQRELFRLAGERHDAQLAGMASRAVDGTGGQWVHGIGLDRNEAPFVADGDELADGDVLAAHIAVRNDHGTVFFGRTVQVSGRGGVLLHRG